ncbi:hypothetical protein MCOR20_008334 [Pyricularia oryzae]|nr:hypothetical protein MCOR20_008334 [Pyricularia oryzae]
MPQTILTRSPSLLCLPFVYTSGHSIITNTQDDQEDLFGDSPGEIDPEILQEILGKDREQVRGRGPGSGPTRPQPSLLLPRRPQTPKTLGVVETGQATVITIDDDDTSSNGSYQAKKIAIPEDPPRSAEEERRHKAREEGMEHSTPAIQHSLVSTGPAQQPQGPNLRRPGNSQAAVVAVDNDDNDDTSSPRFYHTETITVPDDEGDIQMWLGIRVVYRNVVNLLLNHNSSQSTTVGAFRNVFYCIRGSP